jgi:hypothetical protein
MFLRHMLTFFLFYFILFYFVCQLVYWPNSCILRLYLHVRGGDVRALGEKKDKGKNRDIFKEFI